jgi:hypothetical protein
MTAGVAVRARGSVPHQSVGSSPNQHSVGPAGECSIWANPQARHAGRRPGSRRVQSRQSTRPARPTADDSFHEKRSSGPRAGDSGCWAIAAASVRPRWLVPIASAADIDELRAACVVLRTFFANVADAGDQRIEREGGDLEVAREWRALYQSIFDQDPLITARIAPFLLSVHQSERLQPMIGAWLAEAGMLFPDWRSMIAELYTWPQLAAGGWAGTY